MGGSACILPFYKKTAIVLEKNALLVYNIENSIFYLLLLVQPYCYVIDLKIMFACETLWVCYVISLELKLACDICFF